jgi:RNA polymerase Rpb6
MKDLSRTTQVDVGKVFAVSCEQGLGRYETIIAAAQRAREIRKAYAASQQFHHTHPINTVLLEIQTGERQA